MEQTSAANTRKQNTGNSQGGGQQSNNEGGGNKGPRKQGSNAGQAKYQHQTSSSSQLGGQTKQTQNQQQQQSTPKSSQNQTGKAKVVSNMPVANNWGFFEQNAQAKQSTASNATDQVNPHNKARGSVGKRSNHDKQSVDSKELGNSNKEKHDSNNRVNRQNGKGGTKADGKQLDQLALADDAIISAGNTKSKQKGRDLVKYVPEDLPANQHTLEESDTHEKYDQFQDKKKSTYSDAFYSTSLDMKNLDQKTVEKGKRLEEEINQTSARNRHQAEERGQVELHEEGEDDNEEVKYSAVDTKNKSAINKLDGQYQRSNKATAPEGKFTTFHKKIDKKAMDKMTSTYLSNLSGKNPGKDALLAPNNQQPSAVQASAPPPSQTMPVNTNASQPVMMQPPIMPGGGYTHNKTSMPAPPNMISAAQSNPPKFNTGPIQPEANKIIDNPFASNVPKGLKTDVKDFQPTSNSFTPNQLQGQMPGKPFTPGPFGGQNPGGSMPQRPWQPPQQHGQQPFQMQQPPPPFNMPSQQPFYNNQSQYGQGNQYNPQQNFQKRNYNNYGGNQHNQASGMPIPPGQQQNIMPQPQQPMQNTFNHGQFVAAPSFNPQANVMPPPRGPAMPMPNKPPVNNAGQQMTGQQLTAPVKPEEASGGNNPFASFTTSSTFVPTKK